MNVSVASAILHATTMPFETTQQTAALAALVARLLRAGLQALETDRKSGVAIITEACAVLEGAAASDGAPDTASPPTVIGGLTSWQIRRIRAHVEDHLGGTVSVADLADIVHLGPSHFRRAFKKSLGVSPHAFVVERRVRRAQQLMLATGQPLSEIALQVGFADQAHLTTRFHRIVGETPAVWRRERRSGDEMQRRDISATPTAAAPCRQADDDISSSKRALRRSAISKPSVNFS